MRPPRPHRRRTHGSGGTPRRLPQVHGVGCTLPSGVRRRDLGSSLLLLIRRRHVFQEPSVGWASPRWALHSPLIAGDCPSSDARRVAPPSVLAPRDFPDTPRQPQPTHARGAELVPRSRRSHQPPRVPPGCRRVPFSPSDRRERDGLPTARNERARRAFVRPF